MNPGVAKIYLRSIHFSRLSVALALSINALLSIFHVDFGLTPQLAIALVALALGIPHGAIDHLVALPSRSPLKFWLYIAGYIALAGLAVAFIATNEKLGFQLVLAMSALHFGFGDASFRSEYAGFEGRPHPRRLSSVVYALASGAIPVLVPLTSSKTLSALERINSKLDHWAGGLNDAIRASTILLGALALLFFILRREREFAIDLALLLGLSLVATPLITFAFYFGCWHAIRHTARLVPKLPKARRFADAGESGRAIWAAIASGLYALVGTIVLAVALMIKAPAHFSSSLLWATLVLVWALTVPHMLTTARFDLSTLKSR